MVAAGPFEPASAHWYDDADRDAQLQRLACLCEEIAALFEAQGLGEAVIYRTVACAAEQLRTAAVDHDRAVALLSRLPAKPPWLDPRIPGWGPRTPWHDDVSRTWHQLDRAVVELRALATYDRP